jgi:hypothetical protein
MSLHSQEGELAAHLDDQNANEGLAHVEHYGSPKNDTEGSPCVGAFVRRVNASQNGCKTDQCAGEKRDLHEDIIQLTLKQIREEKFTYNDGD